MLLRLWKGLLQRDAADTLIPRSGRAGNRRGGDAFSVGGGGGGGGNVSLTEALLEDNDGSAGAAEGGLGGGGGGGGAVDRSTGTPKWWENS